MELTSHAISMVFADSQLRKPGSPSFEAAVAPVR